MAKLSRNAPCPCGSGKKYTKCCLASGTVIRDQRTAPFDRGSDMPRHFVETDLDKRSNSVLHLVHAGRLDEAEKVCASLWAERQPDRQHAGGRERPGTP